MNVLKEAMKLCEFLVENMPHHISEVPQYDLLHEALMKHQSGDHSGAVKLYEEAIKSGNKLAYLNLGNCYLFGIGVSWDKKKGLEMYSKCGEIDSEGLLWMKKLSNDKFVCGKKLELWGLFFHLLVC